MSYQMKKTATGNEPFETLSALHKSLRRGDELLAMRHAVDLLKSEKVVEKRYGQMLLNYLVTVAYEDVGVADPNVVLFVVQTVGRAEVIKKARPDDWTDEVGNLVGCCVVLICRALKSRYAGNLEAYARHLNNTSAPEIPDHALDMHTRQGRSHGRGQKHFMDQGEVLSNPHPDFTGENDPYAQLMNPVWLKQYPDKAGSERPIHQKPTQPTKPASLFDQTDDEKF